MTKLAKALVLILVTLLCGVAGFGMYHYQAQVRYARCWAPNNGDLFYIGPVYGPITFRGGDAIQFRDEDGDEVIFKGVFCAITPAEAEAEP